MNILLINDSTFKSVLKKEHRVVVAGAHGSPTLMPSQGDFDVTFPAKPLLDVESIIEKLPCDFRPDVLIHFETHNNFFYLGVEELPFPVVWRTIDNHMHTWQAEYSALYDLTFVAQKDYLERFRQHGSALWLPLHCFPSLHYSRNLTRDMDVVFVGSMDPRLKAKRVSFMQAIRERMPLHVHEDVTQGEMAQLYNRSKIVLNECMNGDLNYRVFEAMADAALLLTPAIGNGLAELFTDGRHLVTYRPYDADDVVEKCAMILADWERFRAVAEEGNRLVMQKHTLECRVHEMMDAVEEIVPTYRQSRSDRIQPAAYARLIPLMAAMCNRGFADFSGVEYVLGQIRRRDPTLALEAAERLRKGSQSENLPAIEAKAAEWIQRNPAK